MKDNFSTQDPFENLIKYIESDSTLSIETLLQQLKEKKLVFEVLEDYTQFTSKLSRLKLTEKINSMRILFSKIEGVKNIFIRNEDEFNMDVLLIIESEDLDIDDKILNTEEEFYKEYPHDRLFIDIIYKSDFKYTTYIANNYRQIF
jgi:hypothetical protein